MKKAQFRFNKTISSFFAVLLSLLGFAPSCKGPQVEYGVPSAKYIIKGKIEFSVDSTALKNIQVIIQGDTVYSDVTGSYKITKTLLFPDNQTFPIKFLDVDGALNGEIASLDTNVVFKDPVFKNGNGDWYAGETEKVFDFKLKPK